MFNSPFLFVLVVMNLMIVGAYFLVLLAKEVTIGLFKFVIRVYDMLDDTKRLR